MRKESRMSWWTGSQKWKVTHAWTRIFHLYLIEKKFGSISYQQKISIGFFLLYFQIVITNLGFIFGDGLFFQRIKLVKLG